MGRRSRIIIQNILESKPTSSQTWIYSILKNTTEHPILSRILNEKYKNPIEILEDPEDPGVSRNPGV